MIVYSKQKSNQEGNEIYALGLALKEYAGAMCEQSVIREMIINYSVIHKALRGVITYQDKTVEFTWEPNQVSPDSWTSCGACGHMLNTVFKTAWKMLADNEDALPAVQKMRLRRMNMNTIQEPIFRHTLLVYYHPMTVE